MSQTETQQIQHTDSIDSQDPNQKGSKRKDKTKRPANSAFRQQRLKAWQPILTPKTVLPLFFAVGIIFAPIGGLLLWASSEVQEIAIDYSNCIEIAPRIANENVTDGLEDIPSERISKTFKNGNSAAQPAQWAHYTFDAKYPDNNVYRGVTIQNTNVCRIQFDIESDLSPPVFLYYRMTNFYQNHRRYVKSYDPGQLAGAAKSASSISGTDCAPLDVQDGKPIYPCGLIANSIFNDTFTTPILLNPQDGGNQKRYNMTNQGIAWSSDEALYKKTQYTSDEAIPPPNWRKIWPTYNSSIQPPDISQWEELFVWMRTAGLPTFSKLALRQDNETMTAGRYQIDIWDEFNTTLYGGTKSVLISTRTVMGGKNPFLGIAYLVVGGLCIVLGALFTVTYIVKPRKLGDHTYLTWNNEQPTTATATGRSSRPGENTNSS
ncbi:uncharacterized protein PV09_09293 [Verruconis gallopava]|uniref:Lem3/Cdc50 n=1 Tax=Verruconis gallopava TaxID=253628 RepID=A0A0D2AJ64_9PEZI|nr:uncharacterized protein PV09_09293 [Verruconis gallopava]KIV98958.1 hypothetical protein PV09_09293 [Verruconis gallopava]